MTSLIDDPKQTKRIQDLEADFKAWQKTVDDPLT